MNTPEREELPEPVAFANKAQLLGVASADSAILGRNVLLSRAKTIKRTEPLYDAEQMRAYGRLCRAGREDDLDKWKELEENLKARYDVCEDFAATPSSILLAILNAIAEVNRATQPVAAGVDHQRALHIATLGEACRRAADASAGDYIDRGLVLLKMLEERGYGVFRFVKDTRPQPGEGGGEVPDGSWLWCKLMDFCRKRRLPPAEYNDLFAIVTEAHELNALSKGGQGGGE